MHSQGNFVVLKLLEVADPMDCMPLAGVLLPQAILITSKKQFHGLQIMLKLVFKIVSTTPPERTPLVVQDSASVAGSRAMHPLPVCASSYELCPQPRVITGLNERTDIEFRGIRWYSVW